MGYPLPVRRWFGLVIVLCAGVGTVRGQAPPVEFAFVPGSDAQVAGPDYDFRISRFEIRNDQFVVFLNEALEHLTDARGAYLYFDRTTGDVYVNGASTGSVGTGAAGRSVLMFRLSSSDQIDFNSTSERYQVVTSSFDFSAHPVTGLTWFGAVKYCNWLTLDHDFGEDERAYAEGTDASLSEWRPASITAADWAVRDLTALERSALILKQGFRLPMDGGVDGPSAHGEWFKAASARRDGPSDPVTFDAIYGFGRDVLEGADANFSGSGDFFEIFEPGLTPVGFYDGINFSQSLLTRDTQNAYGLYDVTGNTWEWMQDQVVGDPLRRRNRGGSWRNAASSLLENTVSGTRQASSQDDATGLRVVQSVRHPLRVTPPNDLVRSGPWGGPYDGGLGAATTYTVTNVTDTAVDVLVSADADWVTATPDAPSLGPGESVDVTVTLDPVCTDVLAVGAADALVTFAVAGLTSESTPTRSVSVTVAEPLTVTPTTIFESTMPLGGTPSPISRSYTLQNASDVSVAWSGGWSETSQPASGLPWLLLNGASAVSGSVPGSNGSRSIDVDIDPVAGASLEPGVHTAEITFTDECTGTTVVRDVSLTVAHPFTVSPDASVTNESSGVFGGPFDPLSFEFLLTWVVGPSINWSAQLCTEPPGAPTCTAPDAPWLSLSATQGVLLPTGTSSISADVTPEANALEPGPYTVTVRVAQEDAAFFVDRQVALTVTGLQVTPADDVASSGPAGGPFAPTVTNFTLTNDTNTQMEWMVTLAFSPTVTELDGLTWLAINPTGGVILDPDGTQVVAATVTGDAVLLSPGSYTADLTFIPNQAPLAASVRTLTLNVSGEGFAVPMVRIPGSTIQIGGPNYDYRIGKFEVTNREYARFLNDARRNGFNARGQFMYVDTSTGDVVIAPVAGEGTAPPTGPDAAPLYQASLGRISYDAAQGEPFVVETGFEDHPVVGVSWYGAVKFCNWLTTLQGMPSTELAYGEGPTAGDWRPIPFDPRDALDNRNGYRLPMDGGLAGVGATAEWFKAGSFTGRDADNLPVFESVYGFGRDTLTDADANYLGSGAGPTDATTSAGFFDGSHQLANGSVTNDTGNGFGLYDLTGNVAEWVHDLDLSGGDPRSATRGGHFLDADSLPALTNENRVARPIGEARTFVGFRVAQSLQPSPVTLAQLDTEVFAGGPLGGPFSQSAFTMQVVSDASYTLDDISYAVSSAGGWLSVVGTPPAQVPPAVSVDLLLELAEASESLGVSPPPVEDMSLVPVDDDQPGGPAHDFWIATTEVTNAGFAVFLNSARADALRNAPGLRSSHMMFHSPSGNVYVNDAETGAVISTPLGTPAPVLMYDAGVGRVQLVGETYVPQAGYENHPVVGVTWLGAVKYCNWLTIERGFPSGMRVYTESSAAGEWRPVSVGAADWASRGMTDSERGALVRTTMGYRLPMDGGGAAGAFNEWLKSSAARVDVDGIVVFDAAYGFGRDTLTGDAANFNASGDTAAEGTTPARFFDGVRSLFDEETLTQGSENRYGLFDVTGNVREWMQDPTAGVPLERGLRGGSWRDSIASPHLRVDGRSTLGFEQADDETGFRVVRGAGHVGSVTVNDAIAGTSETKYILLDVREPVRVSPELDLDRVGPFCSDFTETPQSVVYTISNASAQAMPVTVSADQTWVTVTSPALTELTGEVPPGDSIDVTVGTNAGVNDLLPGTHVATVSITRAATPPVTMLRRVEVVVEPSATVVASTEDATYSGFWQVSFAGPEDLTLTIERCPSCDACSLGYEVSVSEPWLSIGPEGALTGTLPAAGEPLVLTVALNESADALLPGDYTGTVAVTLIDPVLGPLPGPLEKTITLEVLDPIAIIGDGADWGVPCAIDTPLRQRVYTLVNRHGTSEISVDVSTDVPWIDIDQGSLAVPPGGEATVTLSLNDLALPTVGEFAGTLTFLDRLTGFAQHFDLLLRIDDPLCATPLIGFDAFGPSGGSVAPSVRGYTIVNLNAEAATNWQVSTDQAWLLVNQTPAHVVPVSGTLGPSERSTLLVTIDQAALPLLAGAAREGTFTGTVMIADTSRPGEALTRDVAVHLTNPIAAVDQVFVGSGAAQPGGPVYSFYMDRYHTTNASFVVFLNDALSQPNDPRGAYLFFDTTTGDVYLNDGVTGAVGSDPGARVTRVFSPGASGQIEFVGGVYRVTPIGTDRSLHPVTGVSWIGAVKYANWLTLDQGFGVGAQCYEEAGDDNPSGWRPKTIAPADWLVRDLNDAERRQLINRYRGYRLPMDDGFNNPDRTVDSADAFNEWYKGAAWSRLPGANSFTNTLYGFGRNVITAADANYRCSQDPFEGPGDCTNGGSTPTGYYDGSTQGGVFVTALDNNGFGLFDMSGNVHTWMQGKYASTSLEDRRTLRGGSWDDTLTSGTLVLTSRTQFAPRHLTDPRIGFRLVRALPLADADADVDGDVDMDDVLLATDCHLGPGAGLGAGCGALDFDGNGDVDLRDMGVVFSSFGTVR